jgi:NhaP-type Na+/H+ or K+/H+ antiporter
VPAAIVGGLYYGLAGAGHLARSNRNFKEQTALISDLLIFVLFGAFVASRWF